jgi:uncharacterized spore protein YtfJ
MIGGRSNPVGDTLIEKALEQLARSADARVVFGEPITAGTRTIVPVARVAYGFGGGLGRRTSDGAPAPAPIDSEIERGVGGGVTARPVGALEITFTGSRYIEFGSGRRMAGAFLAGLVTGLLIAVSRRR